MQTFLKSAAVEDYQEKLESTLSQAVRSRTRDGGAPRPRPRRSRARAERSLARSCARRRCAQVELLRLSEGEWKVKTEKNGAKISIKEQEGSKFFIVKSQVMVDAPKSFFLPIYEVRPAAWRSVLGSQGPRELVGAGEQLVRDAGPRALSLAGLRPVEEVDGRRELPGDRGAARRREQVRAPRARVPGRRQLTGARLLERVRVQGRVLPHGRPERPPAGPVQGLPRSDRLQHGPLALPTPQGLHPGLPQHLRTPRHATPGHADVVAVVVFFF
eukprot:scaffold4781_cov339-Prasinococcus_capsulatus_cf.AAC.19